MEAKGSSISVVPVTSIPRWSLARSARTISTQPDRDTRAELEVLGKELAPRVAVVVYEGHGFQAAAVRAVMTSISLFTRSALPSRIFSSTDDAVSWMRRNHPGMPGVDSVETVLAELRSYG